MSHEIQQYPTMTHPIHQNVLAIKRSILYNPHFVDCHSVYWLPVFLFHQNFESERRDTACPWSDTLQLCRDRRMACHRSNSRDNSPAWRGPEICGPQDVPKNGSRHMVYMGVSINSGYPKWMVYKGMSH